MIAQLLSVGVFPATDVFYCDKNSFIIGSPDQISKAQLLAKGKLRLFTGLSLGS